MVAFCVCCHPLVVSAQGSENKRNLAEVFDLFDYFVFFLSNCTRVLYCFSSETE